ncbi:MAG TPA: CAP domain-containing protein [Candidatus Dormibacteraeota bacterium]|nr:CAP domain-containing protein [Candidatus Dormibacteraeota bacterium]
MTPPPAPPPSTPAPTPAPQVTSAYSGAALAVLQLVNSDRAAAGLAPVRFDPAISKAAAEHAAQNAAANQMTHNGIYQDIGAAGVSWTTIGECLGWNSGAPAPSYVNGLWLQSPEHKAIILGSFTAAGAGWARSASGTSYVSLIFTS